MAMAHHTMECFGLEMRRRAKLLTFSAFIHIMCIIALDGWPIVVDSKNLCGCRSTTRVVNTCTFVDFLEDILYLLLSAAF